MRFIAALLILTGLAGIAAGGVAFGDIGIACMIGGLSALLSGIGFFMAAGKINGHSSDSHSSGSTRGNRKRESHPGIIIAVVGVLLLMTGAGVLLASKNGTLPSQPTEAPSPIIGEGQNGGSGEGESQSSESQSSWVGNSSGNLGDYHVEIKGAHLTKDNEGRSVIVVTYSWTNNSDKTTSAMSALAETAFQDGIELERPIIITEGYDSSNTMKEIRPGNTLDIQSAFVLTSESTVEFEVSKFISFSDEVVSANFEPSQLS